MCTFVYIYTFSHYIIFHIVIVIFIPLMETFIARIYMKFNFYICLLSAMFNIHRVNIIIGFILRELEASRRLKTKNS